MLRKFAVFAAALAAFSLVSCKKSPPAGVAAEVNGHAITTAELEKIYSMQAAHSRPRRTPTSSWRRRWIFWAA